MRGIPLLVALVILALTSVGSAQVTEASKKTPPSAASRADILRSALDDTGDPHEWSSGVSEQSMSIARTLFEQGNAELERSRLTDALKKYDESLVYWDHPATHYNYASALTTLNRPLDTRRHLVAALKYEDGPVQGERRKRALAYLQLIESGLAKVEIRCDQPGTRVFLNEKLLFVAPGKFDDFVLPDEYVISASNNGYLERRYRRTLIPGKPTNVSVHLYKPTEVERERREWSVWGPVGVSAGGLVLGVVGTLLFLDGNDDIRNLDEQTNAGCTRSSPQGSQLVLGCTSQDLPAELQVENRQESERNAHLKQYFGIPMMAVGGAAVLTGAVLMYMNRPEKYSVTPEQLERERGFQVRPVIGPQALGVISDFRF